MKFMEKLKKYLFFWEKNTEGNYKGQLHANVKLLKDYGKFRNIDILMNL